MSIAWKFAPAPIDEELLSSYLVRVSLAHGIGAYRFFSYHLPNIPLWNRDIDRNISDDTLEKIASLSGLTLDRVRDMTLRSYILSPSKVNILNQYKTAAISPWINAIGVYHTTRRQFGLQFCSKCLSIDAAFKKEWRCSLATVCCDHKCMLLDACPNCGSIVVPHRNRISHTNCHICNRSLLRSSPSPVDTLSIEKLDFLKNLYQKVSSPAIPIEVETNALFEGTHSLLSALRKHGAYCRERHVLTDAGKGPIELLRVGHRAQVIFFLHKLLSGWPNSFRDIAIQTALNQRHFEKGYLPNWIQDEVDLLPAGVAKSRVVKKEPLESKLKSVQRKKVKNWRTRRAELLLKMSEKKS